MSRVSRLASPPRAERPVSSPVPLLKCSPALLPLRGNRGDWTPVELFAASVAHLRTPHGLTRLPDLPFCAMTVPDLTRRHL